MVLILLNWANLLFYLVINYRVRFMVDFSGTGPKSHYVEGLLCGTSEKRERVKIHT